MDHKLIPTLLSLAFVGWILYIVLLPGPLDKLNVACTPVVAWPGKLVSAGVRVADTDAARKLDVAVDNGFNNCRRWLWNAFYDEQYQQIKARDRANATPAKPSADK